MTWLKSFVTGLPNVGYPFGNGQTTGIEQIENTGLLSVYPNPVTNGKVTVECKSGEIVNLIELFDSNGNIVNSNKSNQFKAEINVSGLGKGLYFLRIHTEKKVLNEKIIVY
jgi:hypothetical protein